MNELGLAFIALVLIIISYNLQYKERSGKIPRPNNSKIVFVMHWVLLVLFLFVGAEFFVAGGKAEAPLNAWILVSTLGIVLVGMMRQRRK